MFYTKSYLKNLSENEKIGDRTYSQTLNESKNLTQFDIFLSHSYKDKAYIKGLFLELTSMGYSVYVDWIIDSHLNRQNVDKHTVSHIRKRMRQSKALIYATSENSSTSKWMPWELGYMDGETQKCAILPITDYEKSVFIGQEFLSVYPYITKEAVNRLVQHNFSDDKTIWVNENVNNYTPLKSWITKIL